MGDSKDHLLAIGIMTGNSLDAADIVLTAFHHHGKIVDLAFYSLPTPDWLVKALLDLRRAITTAHGNMVSIDKHYQYISNHNAFSFNDILQAYMQFIADAIHGLRAHAHTIEILRPEYDIDNIDLIGFHGQTCTHLPPSIANSNAVSDIYTVQIGDGQMLADLTGITTVYDFRSDDMIHGGEGAPLAPFHNRHLALSLQNQQPSPMTFINGGNTSNIAHVTFDHHGKPSLMGWDAGPFNHLPDSLMRIERGLPCDQDGLIGLTGQIHVPLLKALFEGAATTQQHKNFLLSLPPKSSDPSWYKMVPMLQNNTIPFSDRLRTAEYFSAYALYHSLGLTPETLILPSKIAVFGGGWKNPVIFKAFKSLLNGNTDQLPIMNQHIQLFQTIYDRMQRSGEINLIWSDSLGFNSNAMEARIFADLARCRILNMPFTGPETTGVRQPTVCGLICYPQNSKDNVTPNLKTHLGNTSELGSPKKLFDGRWSRAAAGWKLIQSN
jgi:anhydro-N-acetylmuramic acid kinase